jgi:hypothetical protein
VDVNHELSLLKMILSPLVSNFLSSRIETALYVRLNRSPVSVQDFVREIDVDASGVVVTSQMRFPPEVWFFVCRLIVRSQIPQPKNPSPIKPAF